MSRSAKGNIIEKIGKCPDCGKEFNPFSFSVMVGKSGPYASYLCRKCAKKDGAKIIEHDKLSP